MQVVNPDGRPMTNPIKPELVQGIVFDAFGTLVDIGDRRQPYRQLLQLALVEGRCPKQDDARQIMSRNVGFRDVADWLGINPSEKRLAAIEADLERELQTVRMYPEAQQVLSELRSTGRKIGLCSNLAPPYAEPVRRLLPFELDVYAWSFEVGAIKPDPAIYAHICETLQLPPESTLFIGDTYDADVSGPRSYGMQALHVVRDGESPDELCLQSLDDLLSLLR